LERNTDKINLGSQNERSSMEDLTKIALEYFGLGILLVIVAIIYTIKGRRK